MKREILFRGKRVFDNKFEHGFLSWHSFGDGVNYFVNNNVVYPETVGQFTGITDKNELKIFEGDILETEEGIIWVVSWSEQGEWIACDVFYEETELLSDIVCYNIRIVGNRFDNKELLNESINN